MSRSKTRVLLTGAGGSGTIAVLKALKATSRYHLIGADASSNSVGLDIADEGYLLPLGEAAEFEGVMRAIVRRSRPDFVVPLCDEEIPKVHALLAKDFPDIGIVSPHRQFCVDMMDKWEMFQQLTKAGIPVAPTWLASDAQVCDFPAVAKPRWGRGSRGVAYVQGPEDLARYLKAANRGPEQYIVQRRITGTEYTTSVVVALGGPTLAVVPKETLVKIGITQVGITRRVPEIESMCCDLQNRLRPDGPINVQLMMGEDRIPYVIEVNPRYSTTVALTLAAGIDEIDVVLRHAMGEEIDPLDFQEDLMMIRYPEQHYVLERDWRHELPDPEA